MQHADKARRLRVRANADTPADADPRPAHGGRGHRPAAHRAHVPGRAEDLRRAADPRRGRGRPEGGARRAAAAAAQGLHPDPRGDGRPAGHDPADRPAAARVPARPHRARGARGPGRVARRGRRGRPAPAAGRQPAARAEPDARPARRAPGPGAAGPVRAAGAGDRRGGLLPPADGRRPAGRDHDPAGRVDPGARAGHRRGRGSAQGGGRRQRLHPASSRSAR